jgi:hypothetical protein
MLGAKMQVNGSSITTTARLSRCIDKEKRTDPVLQKTGLKNIPEIYS